MPKDEANAPPAAAPEQPIVTIDGERVALGPLRRDLLPLYQRWINDPAVVRTLGEGLRPLLLEDEQQWYERSVGATNDVTFQIYVRSGWRPIGTTAIVGMDQRHGTANFGIMVGEKDCWDQGYGTEATRLVLDYAFNVLGLHNIMLSVYDFNHRGVRAYEKAGFKVIGRRRQALRLGHERHDVIFMDALATEFASPVLQRLYVEGQHETPTT